MTTPREQRMQQAAAERLLGAAELISRSAAVAPTLAMAERLRALRDATLDAAVDFSQAIQPGSQSTPPSAGEPIPTQRTPTPAAADGLRRALAPLACLIVGMGLWVGLLVQLVMHRASTGAVLLALAVGAAIVTAGVSTVTGWVERRWGRA